MSKEYSKEELKTELLTRYPLLRDCIGKIEEMLCMMERTYRSGGKILLCGNGGSCADCDHIVGELMKGFLLKRPVTDDKAEMFGKICPDKADFLAENLQTGIPAISLPSQSAVISAFANDVKPELVFAQLVFGYGGKNDLFWGISTSGNSENVVYAAIAAKAMGLKTAALTGEKESRLSRICDCCIMVPETETFKVQELHLPVYHYLCAALESNLFGQNNK